MELNEMFTGLGGFTKIFIIGGAIVSAAMTWRMFSPYSVLTCVPMNWKNILTYFTSVFYMGKFDFNFIFQVYFIVIFIGRLEKVYSSNASYPDFIFLLFFVYILSLVLSIAVNWGGCFALSLPLKEALVYIACKRNPEEIIHFMMFIKVKAKIFPFVSAGFSLLSGNSIVNEIVGIAVGHIFVYLKDQYPTKSFGKDYLVTPNWVRRVYDYYTKNRTEVRQAAQAGFRHFQGRGVQIG